ncbi:restriction endonuclease subunit S [Lactiplantibacillus plantarum]|uniref:restriction endonuclease subunit S n=1 Tax=Lactiplantibacillus plantarum TaxID=1590 RepID=UPI002B4BDB86|nr:restriction endonuclease subunit S [Lactiplantibacillus plantarum]WRM30966.1 restriction endonuclease subunit S [Lactiplantibacillus plantarum]
MKNENLVPKVRFKGFSDPWEQRKLGELFNERKEKSSQGELLSVTINSGIVKFDTLDRKNNSSADKSNYRVVRYGDIAYNSMRMWQGASGLSMYNGIVSPAYTVITPRTNTDAGFMAVNFKRKSMIQVFQRNSQGLTSDTWNLKFPVLKNIRISIPKITEQQIITELFTVINNLIAANEDKLEQLKTLKKLMMQKIFSQEWRFKGFTDPWEQRKLFEVTERVTRKNTQLQSTLPLTISAQYGLIDQNTFFDKQVASRDVSGYYLIKNGEFAYNKSYSKGYPVGTIKRLDKYSEGVLSTLYILFKVTNADSQFLVTYFEGNKWYQEVMKRATEGARNHGLLNISPKDFFNMHLFIPVKSEQYKVGSIILKISCLIAANEDKLNQLKKLKKYLMQNMFV